MRPNVYDRQLLSDGRVLHHLGLMLQREETWQQLLQGIRFVSGEFGDDDAFRRLRETVEKLDVERGTMGNHAYYLSIPPRDFAIVAEQLKKSGLVDDTADRPDRWRRVVIEKPFGHDLASARELTASIRRWFAEDEVFRIDHYLGKETVQNLMALRFANGIFEPLWNRQLIDHVQTYSVQKDAKASEIFHALVLALFEARDHLDLSEIPARGKWGTPTAQAFPISLKGAFQDAIAHYKRSRK